jgi:hypothetical protein
MYSQAGQDEWVISHIKQGYYLEIGAYHPQLISNTYLLEQNGWEGLSIDIDNQCEEIWHQTRKNRLIIGNALTTSFNWLPRRVEYLSLDIDPARNTFEMLTKLPHKTTRFSLITYEHDYYLCNEWAGHDFRERSRQMLNNLGYQLVKADVCYDGKPYEDWWIDKTIHI